MSLKSPFFVVPVVATQVFVQMGELVGTLHALQSGEISAQMADAVTPLVAVVSRLLGAV